jgi:D-alanyl-lipoteichoic acid acyltransferase DltB (MBOAT superfamily)
MPATVVAFLVVLLLAGIVLMWEARTGRFTAQRLRWDLVRGALFFLATVVGGALLIRSMGGTVLLAMAFIPVTILSLMRFVALTRRRWAGMASFVTMAVVLFVGLQLSLLALPEPIDQVFFIEHVFQIGGESTPQSIDPDARRTIRM